MLGFIKKDLLMLKGNLKTFILLLIFYVLLAYLGEFDISFLPPFFSVMMMLSTFSYDNYNNFDAYAISFPNGKRNIILSKYLASLILTFGTTILVLILAILISYLKGNISNLGETSLTMLVEFLATVIILSIMYPIIFKFGIEKARLVIFILVFGIGILGGFLLKFINFDFLNSLSFLANYWFITILIITILVLIISYILSRKIYLKKEF